MQNLAVLYSFRRCPYAIRARMALSISGAKIRLHEVDLKNKPSTLLTVSPKGTVPVLVLPDQTVIEESLEIMQWALTQNDPEHWGVHHMNHPLIQQNDSHFKEALDRYKYADRFPEQTPTSLREKCLPFIEKLEAALHKNTFLTQDQISFVDVAIFPFIRQFSMVDKIWFDSSHYVKTQEWLAHFLALPLFQTIMVKKPVS